MQSKDKDKVREIIQLIEQFNNYCKGGYNRSSNRTSDYEYDALITLKKLLATLIETRLGDQSFVNDGILYWFLFYSFPRIYEDCKMYLDYESFVENSDMKIIIKKTKNHKEEQIGEFVVNDDGYFLTIDNSIDVFYAMFSDRNRDSRGITEGKYKLKVDKDTPNQLKYSSFSKNNLVGELNCVFDKHGFLELFQLQSYGGGYSYTYIDYLGEKINNTYACFVAKDLNRENPVDLDNASTICSSFKYNGNIIITNPSSTCAPEVANFDIYMIPWWIIPPIDGITGDKGNINRFGHSVLPLVFEKLYNIYRNQIEENGISCYYDNRKPQVNGPRRG